MKVISHLITLIIIVIDEFHHAVAKSYSNITSYFKPKFLLGLTATPERLDNKDVFELCDYNVVYELRLKDAINKGFLVPFHYYGIYDETDFSNIPIINGKYKEDELERRENKKWTRRLSITMIMPLSFS